jgi:hypothetical protein
VDVITVQVGDLYVGLRANDEAIEQRLRDLLAPHVVDDVEAPPNLSLAVGTDDGTRRGVHLLYRSCARELRTPSLGRLLRAVPAQLDGYAPPPRDRIRLNARALVAADHAVLLDGRCDAQLERAEPRLARAGYRRSDAPFVEIDTATGELVLGPPRVDFAPAAAAALEADDPPGDREVLLDGRRLPVRSMLVIDPSTPDRPVPNPAGLLSGLSSLAADRHRRVDPEGVRLLASWLKDGRLALRPAIDTEALLEVARSLG